MTGLRVRLMRCCYNHLRFEMFLKKIGVHQLKEK